LGERLSSTRRVAVVVGATSQVCIRVAARQIALGLLGETLTSTSTRRVAVVVGATSQACIGVATRQIALGLLSETLTGTRRVCIIVGTTC
jgi:hypothetical protein